MRKTNRKAFTIVELVIVIAVIAILAAILIPTFSGMIRNVKKSADESEAASLNTKLAISNIKTEDDLYKVIAETYGQNKADTFAPRSAQYGLHYWYDTKTNTIVLKAYSELETSTETDTETGAETANKVTLLGATTLLEGETPENEFYQSYKNSFRMFNERYYLLDKGGSVIGDALNALDKGGDDIVEKLKALIDIKASKPQDLKDMAKVLLEKLATVAIVSNEMTFVYDADKVTTFYFVPGIETISSNVVSNKDYVAKAAKVTSITIPESVTLVQENALWFDGNTVELKTSLADMEAVKKVFQAKATNGKIIANGVTYTINVGTITGSDGSSGTLEFGNKVTSFNLTYPASGENFYYDSVTNTLYVSHNASSFNVGTDNDSFEASIDKKTVVKDVNWTVSDDAPFSLEGGVVTISVPNKYNDTFNYEGKITATSVTNNEATADLNICVVTMMAATVKVGSNTLAVNNSTRNNTLELTYDGTAATAKYEIGGFTCTHNHSYAKCCTDATPVFTTTGDRFTIGVDTDGKLKLMLNTAKADLEGTQTFTVKVGAHIEKTFTVTVIDNSSTDFEKVLDNNYLYRVGNSNNITLGQLFKTAKPGKGNISVAIYDASVGKAVTIDKLTGNHLTAAYTKTLTAGTWATSEIDFGGTGVAIIEIKNDAGTQTAIVEVVEGYNITDASQLKSNANNILLNDIKLASGAKFSLSGNANNHKILYGNGFTLDITDASTKGNGTITLSNADIDNVKIIGKVYETYQDLEGSGQNEYYASVIYVSSGSVRISNSYIFGGRSNIRVNADLEIVNSVVECARLSNIHVSNGKLTIDGLTTINEPRAENNNVLGLGITFGNDAMASAKIVIKGELTQYNWLRESDEGYLPKVTGLSTVVDKIFAETKYLHTIDGVKYVNMGIACLSEKVSTSAVTFSNTNNNYEATNISSGGFTGFIISITDAKYDATAADLVYRTNAYNWAPTKQDNTIPTINWSNYSSGTASVTFERGQSFEFDPNVLTATKHGNKLIPTVTVNGVDYTGKKITFTEDQTCTIKYTIKDAYVYDVSGNLIGSREYVYYLVVDVTTTIPEIKKPEFSFGNASGYTEVTIGDKIYINPTPTDTSKFQAITVSGQTIYAPIVELSYKDNSSDFTPYYPIFGNGLTITWYDENGNATTYSSSSSLSAMPTGSAELTWITDITNLKGDKNWEGYKNVSGSGLVRAGSAVGRDVDGTYYATVEFSFRAEGTETYYYYVRYHGSAHSKPSGCVTGDTLITLADGTQKEIQYVTYEDYLLVWNHFTGEYDVVPAAIIFNHGYGDNTVIKLNFSDGTQVKAVNLHQFLDADLNKYVTISADTVADYVGHSFVKQNGESYKTVTLESYEISEEYIEAYGIISALHYNILVEGMFSTDFMPVDYDLFNYFAIGDGMIYDAEQMQKDIEEYGLYTYEDFADYLTYEQFVGFNVQYFKIAVGKGHYTYEGILDLIDGYLNA